MPFVTLEDVSGMLPAGLVTHYQRTPKDFERAEYLAGIEVTDLTGIDAPATIAERPDWIINRIAAIIAYREINRLSLISEEQRRVITNAYNEAVAYLKTKRVSNLNLDLFGGGAYGRIKKSYHDYYGDL